VTFDLDLDLENTLDAGLPGVVTIVCKFGGDPAMCLREEAICAKVYRRDGRTDGRTDDGRRANALAHSWNELIKITTLMIFSHHARARNTSSENI